MFTLRLNGGGGTKKLCSCLSAAVLCACCNGDLSLIHQSHLPVAKEEEGDGVKAAALRDGSDKKCISDPNPSSRQREGSIDSGDSETFFFSQQRDSNG